MPEKIAKQMNGYFNEFLQKVKKDCEFAKKDMLEVAKKIEDLATKNKNYLTDDHFKFCMRIKMIVLEEAQK